MKKTEKNRFRMTDFKADVLMARSWREIEVKYALSNHSVKQTCKRHKITPGFLAQKLSAQKLSAQKLSAQKPNPLGAVQCD